MFVVCLTTSGVFIASSYIACMFGLKGSTVEMISASAMHNNSMLVNFNHQETTASGWLFYGGVFTDPL